MKTAREVLIARLIETRIQNIRNNSAEGYWIEEALMYGWNGYRDYSARELLEDADMLGLKNLPTVGELM